MSTIITPQNYLSLLSDSNPFLQWISSVEYESFPVTGHREVRLKCVGCGKSRLIDEICNNKACPDCRRRIRYRICKKLHGIIAKLEIRPSQVITQVFPIPAIPIDQLDNSRVKNLINIFAKFRRRVVFKNVRGGFWCVEISFNLENFTARPHLHVLYSTDRPSNQLPIDKGKVEQIWFDLTGGTPQRPKAIQPYTKKALARATAYMTKSIGGQVSAMAKDRKILQATLLPKVAGTTERLEAQQRLQYLTYQYNLALRDQRRYGTWGLWWGVQADLDQEPCVCNECGSQDHKVIVSPPNYQD